MLLHVSPYLLVRLNRAIRVGPILAESAHVTCLSAYLPTGANPAEGDVSMGYANGGPNELMYYHQDLWGSICYSDTFTILVSHTSNQFSAKKKSAHMRIQ